MHVCAPAGDAPDARRAHTITVSSLERFSTRAMVGAEGSLSPMQSPSRVQANFIPECWPQQQQHRHWRALREGADCLP